MNRGIQQTLVDPMVAQRVDVNGFDDVLDVLVLSLSLALKPLAGTASVLETDRPMALALLPSMPQDPNPNTNASHSFSHNQIRRAADMAGVLLDTKRSFLQENNFLDINEKEPLSSNHISRATHIRAERVKATLALKYMMIERAVTSHYDEDGNVRFPGVEGVYNPLQIIRNRKIRAKYREFPKPLTFKSTPLASSVFSNRKSKFIWSIELSELISDSSWRVNHIHELIRPDGEKWFPIDKNKSSLKSGSSKQTLPLDDSGDIESSKVDVSGPDLISKEIKDSGKRDRLRSRVKRTLKYTTDSRSTISSDSNDFKYKFSRKRGKEQKYDEQYSEEGVDNDSNNNISNNTNKEDEKNHQKTEIDPLNNIKIRPLVSKRSTATDPLEIIIDQSPRDGQISSIVDELLKMIFEEEIYLENSTLIKLHFLQEIYPRLFNCNLHQIQQITDKLIPELNRKIIDINDDSIPTYEAMSSSSIAEMKRLVQTINEDYSIKIDNLLTGTDRLIGEINTSMTLELRKIDERIDKLNSSLFGGNFTINEIKMSDSGNYRVMYFLLENSIVILLRLIWVFVNIYKVLSWIVLICWKVVKFILF